MNQKKVDQKWLRLAFSTANNLSQDTNSQTGAVIVNPLEDSLYSAGANRAHYGLKDRYEGTGNRVLFGRPEKYTDLTHAERDAIYVANRKGISLVGGTIYATWTPCKTCAELILNNGIKRFVTHEATNKGYNEARKDAKGRNDWTAAIEEAVHLLKKGDISYEVMNGPLENVEFLFNDSIRTI